jgi:hypothetical protein
MMGVFKFFIVSHHCISHLRINRAVSLFGSGTGDIEMMSGELHYQTV